MSRRLLREYIHFILAEKSSKSAGARPRPEGPADGRFGEYLFADQRDDVPSEPNTPEENSLADALEKHYRGRPAALQAWIDEIVKDKEDYPAALAPPAREHRAYRTMTVPPNVLEALLGKRLRREDYDGEVHFAHGGTQQPIGGKSFYSWTLEPDIFHGLRKDWGSLFSTNWIRNKVGASGFVVFLSADVHSNVFVLNPDVIRKSGLAGEFAYEQEVLSVGPVKLADVSYFYFDENTSPEIEAEMTRMAINGIEE